jgi:hypothetical protein
MRLSAPSVWSICCLAVARASVTVYHLQAPISGPTGTAAAAAANYTGAAAYDPILLTAPAIPSPPPPNTFFIQLFNSNVDQGRLSIPVSGSFYGFSIEMSVISQVRELSPILL